ncbi:MAG: arsenite methyltransferase [Actinomycetota bacterium]
MSQLREQVRQRYAEAVQAVTDEGRHAEDPQVGCCGGDAGSCCGPHAGSLGSELYGLTERDSLPEAAVLASLGCGNPMAVAALNEGETVLDLGSGGGIDVLLSAQRVGPSGKVYGLDMTDEMLALALRNQEQAGVDNVEFLKGYIESIPLPAGTVDVVISNCVINLSIEKPAVFAEMFRVLKPGGRVGITDVVSNDELSSEDRARRGSYVGCIAGALSFAEYRSGLETAGFSEVAVDATHEVTDGMHSATVKAIKPGS